MVLSIGWRQGKQAIMVIGLGSTVRRTTDMLRSAGAAGFALGAVLQGRRRLARPADDRWAEVWLAEAGVGPAYLRRAPSA